MNKEILPRWWNLSHHNHQNPHHPHHPRHPHHHHHLYHQPHHHPPPTSDRVSQLKLKKSLHKTPSTHQSKVKYFFQIEKKEEKRRKNYVWKKTISTHPSKVKFLVFFLQIQKKWLKKDEQVFQNKNCEQKFFFQFAIYCVWVSLHCLAPSLEPPPHIFRFDFENQLFNLEHFDNWMFVKSETTWLFELSVYMWCHGDTTHRWVLFVINHLQMCSK